MSRKAIIGFIVLAMLSATPFVRAGSNAGADALLQQFSSIRNPQFDSSRRTDRAYLQEYGAQVMAAMERRTQIARQFAERFPDHPHAPDMLLFVAQQTRNNKAEQIGLYRKIVANYPGSEAAQAAAGPIRQIEAVGKPFDLSFTDAITGRHIDMSSLRGKVVIIDFWATWCGPCCAEMPKNKQLYAQWKAKGVEFIGVSLDSKEGGLAKLKDFVAKNQITWPQYFQGDGWMSDFSRSWGVNAIPQLFVVDTNGNLVTTEGRGQLQTLIPQLLSQRGQNVADAK